jgi:polar amino acid transport system substrate-binding protein
MWYSIRTVVFIMLLLAVTTLPFYAAQKTERPLVLVCDVWPPYQTQHDGRVNGFATRVVHHVLNGMGVPVKSTKAFPWQRAMGIFQAGGADVLFSANHTADREMFARYPEESLVDSPWILWSRKKNLRSLDDLRGLKIGVVSGYSYTLEFWDYIETHCVVEKVHSDAINFKKLAMGRLDAIAAEYGNGRHVLNSLHLKGIRPHTDIVVKTDGLYAIFNKNTVTEKFVQEFSFRLKEYKASEGYRDLYRAYFMPGQE